MGRVSAVRQQTLEGSVRIEQFELDALVPPFDFAGGGGRSGFSQSLGDAVVLADPLEEHLGWARSPEATGELFAVVAEHFLGLQLSQKSSAKSPTAKAAVIGGDRSELAESG
jgi:hypothetical protein